MPPAAAGDVIVITSSSSSEEGGEARGRSTGIGRHARHSAGDAVRKKKRKEGEVETGAAAGGEVRRGGEECGRERTAKTKPEKKKKQEKGAMAASPSSNGRDAVACPLPTSTFPTSPVKRLVAGGERGGGNGGGSGRNVDRVRKESSSRVAGGEVWREGEERKAKTKKKKKNMEKEKKGTSPSPYAGDVVETGDLVKRLGSDGGSGGGNGRGGKNIDGMTKKKQKKEDVEVETNTIAGGEVWRKGEEKKVKVKRKGKNEEGKEGKAASPFSCAGDVVATSDEVGRLSSTCSFPMSRVKRIISGSEDGGGNDSKGGSIRTSLDAVFLINKASELFLELFAQDAHAHAKREHKKVVFYKHLSSSVCNGKRYEFLSDFVPEKVRAEDAIKALAEQS